MNKMIPPYARVMSPSDGFHEEFLDEVSYDGFKDLTVFELEIHCSRPLHYQAMMRSCEVTVKLLALYLIMRQPNIDLQWLSVAFSDV